MAVLGCAQLQRDQTGRLQPRLAVLARQREQAQAGAVAVLGVASLDQQALHGASGGHTDALAPVDQPLRRPLQVGAVGGGQVLDHGGEAALVSTAGVGGHALATVQQLHHPSRDAGFYHLTDQGLWHAVAVTIDLDVVVDVNAHGPEHRELPGLQRQRSERWSIEVGKCARPTAGQLLEGFGVKPIKQYNPVSASWYFVLKRWENLACSMAAPLPLPVRTFPNASYW